MAAEKEAVAALVKEWKGTKEGAQVCSLYLRHKHLCALQVDDDDIDIYMKEKKDEDTFGKFEALSTRASQTAEFDSLAAKGDFGKVTELARAWDATVRKEVLEKASETLKGARAPAPHAASPCRALLQPIRPSYLN